MLTKILGLTMIFGSLSVYANANQVNMGDNLDENLVPAEQEAREKIEKPKNLPDHVDRNTVPAPFEERKQEEQAIGIDPADTSSDQQKKDEESSDSM